MKRFPLLSFLLVMAFGCGDSNDDNGSDKDASVTDSSVTDSTVGDGGVEEENNECATGGGEAPVGTCLVGEYAGTYTVTTTSGTHARGSITVAADGSIDYDNGLNFPADGIEGVYDRLDCCNRISVEMTQRGDNNTSLAPDARHRVDIFTENSTVGSAVTSFEYFPNWPSEDGKVVVTVQ